MGLESLVLLSAKCLDPLCLRACMLSSLPLPPSPRAPWTCLSHERHSHLAHERHRQYTLFGALCCCPYHAYRIAT